MKKFQILDRDNNAISISALDAEAAAFWNKKVDEKSYAFPFALKEVDKDAPLSEHIKAEMYNAQLSTLNWFEIIGWNIANQGNYTSGWDNVIHTMMAENLGEAILGGNYTLPEYEDTDNNGKIHLPVSIEERIYSILKQYKPFVNLIKHWESKGYKPISLD